MIRCPIGSVPAAVPSAAMNMPPAIRVFGTVSVSTTLIHGAHFIDEKYVAAALISSSVIAFANWTMRPVFVFRVSELLRASFLKSDIVFTKYS
jgi:hypothetical protein